MTRPLLYVAAPYGDTSPIIRAWHTDRAALLGRLALACGYAPIVVHPSIAAGVYGDDSDPEQRAAGMAATLDVCRAVVAGGGAVWALLRDDRTISDGTAAEWACMTGTSDHQVMEWCDWRRRVKREAPTLLPEWDRLAVRPKSTPTIGPWHDAFGWECRDYEDGTTAAIVDAGRWRVWINAKASEPDAFGPETGAAGRAAADAALRAMGVLS